MHDFRNSIALTIEVKSILPESSSIVKFKIIQISLQNTDMF